MIFFRSHLILWALGWSLGAFQLSAQVEAVEPEPGHVGMALVETPGWDGLLVDYVAEGSPAFKAGLQKGDRITAIQGITTRKMFLSMANRAIDGEIGSRVDLSVIQGESPEKLISMVRASVPDTFSPAAEAGDPRAETSLAYFYESGQAAARDPIKAVEWYRKAAEQGHALAQLHLGALYFYGQGVSKDMEAGAAWYLKAAQQGNALAERDIAFCYLGGEGVPRSDREAFNWFYSAAEQDDRSAQAYLGGFYRRGQVVARDDRQAFAWYYRSAELRNPYGAWGLAYMYEKGRGVPRNLDEALKWYRKALAALPQNQPLKKSVALTSLNAFLESPGSVSKLNPSDFMAAFRREIVISFCVLLSLYALGCGFLLRAAFGKPDAPARFLPALGWMSLYMEGQGLAMFWLCFAGQAVSAGMLMAATSLLSALPIVISSCGTSRSRLWAPSPCSFKELFLYGAGAIGVIFLIGLGYENAYKWVTGLPFPQQSTFVFLSKAKQASAWPTYLGIAFLMPVAEEVIFRGYLFDALRARLSGGLAVLISACAFALIHLQWNYFVPLFGFGLIVGWVKLKTQSLRLPVLLHMANNALFFLFGS